MKSPVYDIPIDQIRKFASEGKPDREIGRLLGCPLQIVWQRRKEHGISPGNPSPKKLAIDIDRIRELAGQGWSDRRIAIELGCGPKLIRVRRKEQGIEAGCPKFRNTISAPAEDDIGDASVTKADAEFERLMNGRVFGQPRNQPTEPLGAPLPKPLDLSLTGSSAAMCAR
jgi:hypothetical protein